MIRRLLALTLVAVVVICVVKDQTSVAEVAQGPPSPRQSALKVPDPEIEIKTEEVREMFTVRATAYTKNDPGMDGRGITSSGTRVKPISKPDPDTGLSTIAAHPSFLPPGTIIVIPELSNYPNKGRFIVEDTGGAIHSNRVDVCFASRSRALDFGVQRLQAYVEEYADAN